MGPSVPGGIPWSLVHLWAEHHDLTRAEFSFLDACIQKMDVAYIAWWAVKQKQEGRP